MSGLLAKARGSINGKQSFWIKFKQRKQSNNEGENKYQLCNSVYRSAQYTVRNSCLKNLVIKRGEYATMPLLRCTLSRDDSSGTY